MRYLVRAKVKEGRQPALIEAIRQRTLGKGSVAYGEYVRNMEDARLGADGTVRWVEVCFCAAPLEEELPYWEEFFAIAKVQDAHARRNCRDENGTEPWACADCDCTARLEDRLRRWGQPFVATLADAT